MFAAAAAALVAIVVSLYHLPLTGNDLFYDDAADYVRAADHGMRPLWLNTNSIPLGQLLALRNQPAFRAHPWDTLDSLGDNASLRHFHVPFSFYVLGFLRTINPAESSIRRTFVAFSAASCGILLLVLAELSVPLPLAFLLALLAGVQSRNAVTSVDPSPHVLYMLFALLTLFATARYLAERRTRHLLLAAAGLGFSVATLEFSLELMLCLPLAMLLIGTCAPARLPRWRDVRRPLLQAAGIFLLTTFLLWPGGWLRLGYVQSYGLLSAQMLLRHESAFGGVSALASIDVALYRTNPGLVVLTLWTVVASLVLLVTRRISVASCVFLSYTLLAFGLGLGDRFRLSTYCCEFLFFLIATAGLLLADMLALPAFHGRLLQPRAGPRSLLLTLAAVLLVAIAAQEVYVRPPLRPRPWLRPVIAAVRGHVPPGDTVLVNADWQALRLYLPGYHFEPTRGTASSVPRAIERNENTRFALYEGTVTPAPRGSLLSVTPIDDGRSATLWKYGE